MRIQDDYGLEVGPGKRKTGENMAQGFDVADVALEDNSSHSEFTPGGSCAILNV